MVIKIYDREGNEKAEVSPNDNSTLVTEIEGDDVLSLSFRHYGNVVLEVDDYVDYGGERYRLCERYRPRQKSTVEWEYDLKLYGAGSLLRNILVIKRVDGEDEPEFTLTAPPREHVAMIVNCLNEGMGGIADWKVGQVDGTENIVIDYHGKYCDEALKEIAEKVGAEYWTEGSTVNVCRCEHGEPITLGYDKGLLGISPDRADNVKFYTRLYPVGSSRNIDREKYGHSRLQLPGGAKYVEVNAEKYGRVDHYEKEAFAGIYPRRTGTVSSVRSEVVTGDDGEEFTIYYFKDEGLTFDPNDYEIGGLVKRVSFQEGSELAGLGAEDNRTYYFEVNFDSATREFEIITTWPYEDGMQLPGGSLVPKEGDKYILWNLRMPDEYYGMAEAELLAAVNDYNETHGLDVTVFKASTDHVWVEDNAAELYIGRRVRLESTEYFPETGYRDSRIIKITRKVNMPSQMDIEIGDVLSRTSKQKFTDDIAETRSYARGIAGSISLPDIIRTGDRTKPTDNNLYSARRVKNDFLSKVSDDVAAGRITFAQGLRAVMASTMEGGVQFGKEFADGVKGFGGKIDEHGDAWLGGLRLRDFLEVPELRYNRTEITVGNAWGAPGGGVIKSVTPVRNADGTLTDKGTITLHLEDGEIGAVAVGDLCQGIFHDAVNPSDNATADSDDGRGNFHFAGFCTVYFRVISIIESGRNSVFRYQLREVSERWTWQHHPSAQMHFVGYGNITDKTRQTSRYSTRTYERYLHNVNGWEIGSSNIAAQFGDMSNLSIFGIDMQGYSAYLDNVYMRGRIEQLDLTPRLELEYGGDGFMAYGDTRTVKCRMYRGWLEMDGGIEWTVTRDTGNASADAAWSGKAKAADFAGEIAIHYGGTDDDLGPTPETGAAFTFTAKAGGQTASAKLTLRRNPQDGTDGTTGRNYTQNLLLGSEFPVTRRWRPAQNVDIDNTHTLEGRNSIRSSQSGLSASAWRGITQDYAGTIQAGDVFTASAWCYCENLGGIDPGVRLEIQVFAGNERVATGATSLEPSKAGEWQQAKTTVTIPEGATRMAVTLYVTKNGTVWFSSPKLERGENAAPEWTPNPADRIGTPTEMFYLSTSNTELAGGNWSFNKPVVDAGRYLWTRTEWLYGDGTVEQTEPVCVTGAKGDKGDAGTSVTIVSKSVTYQRHTSGTDMPTGEWKPGIPFVAKGEYLWTRTVVTYSDGNETTAYSVAYQGINGINGTSVAILATSTTYAKTPNAVQPDDDAFTCSDIAGLNLQVGDYMWVKTVVTYTGNKEVKSYNVSRVGSDGADGMPGAKGADGKTSYVHHAYANSADGSKDFSTTYFAGAMYVGVCTDFNSLDPTEHTYYTWARLRGEDGAAGNSYTNNLLRNSDFADGADFWKVYGGTVDTAEKVEGRNSVYFSYSELPDNKYYGWGYYMDYEVTGTDFTFSVDVLVKNLETLTNEWGAVSIELRCLDANGNRLKTYGAVAVPATAGKWQRFRVSGKTLAGTKQVSVHFMLRRDGTVWFNSPKLEFGDNPSPVWTPYASGNAGVGFTPNMLPGTRDWDGWTLNGSWASGGSFEGLDVMHGDAADITASHLDIAKTGFLDLEADTVYTLSMWAKGSGSFQSFVYPDVNAKTLYIDGAASESKSSDTFAQHTLATEWKRYYVVFRTRAGNALTGKSVVPVRIFKGDNEVWIAGVKLEKGENHATQWSPTQDEMVGEDAYSVMLTNESHVFEEGVAAMAECGISALKGNVRVPVTIGTISGMPPSAGMHVSVIGNGSTSATVRVRVAASLAAGGELTIPVTVDGLVFQKTFSWSIARRGQTGPQGIQGCIYRMTQWRADVEYHNDSALTGDGIRYIDMVLIPNPALATKAYAFICNKSHTSSGENAPNPNVEATEHWTKLNSMAPIYTPFLLADNAVITLLQSNQILVMKEDGVTVNAAMGRGDFPLWVGATEATEAPFRVDATGKAYMTGAEISGHVTAGDPDGQRVALLPDDKTMKIYDESGHEVSSFEGNTYPNPLNLFGSTSDAIAMKQRTGTHYGYGSGVTYGRGTHTLTGNGLGTNTEYENLIISGVISSDAPVEVIVSGYLYTEYKEQATLPSYPGGSVTPEDSGDTPVTGITPIDPGGTVPLYNSTARLTLYIDTYSDSLLTTRVGSQEIARCGKKGDGVLISQKRVKTTTGGYHVLRLAISMTATGNGVTATVKWGKAVSVQQPDISGTYTSDFYMSRYFANGFCLGISKNNYISAYDQGDKKGMRFVMENAGYGIDVSNAGIRHKHHGGNWVSMPLFVMKGLYRYVSSPAKSYSLNGGKSFNDKFPTASYKGQGLIRLTYPPEWSTLGTLSAANLIVNVTGYGKVAEDGESPVKANIREITSTYIEITLSDDKNLNDGGFLIDISLLE